MISMCKKPTFLGSKATILLVLLILAASATLVVAPRPSSLLTRKPKFGASRMYFPQSNRPIQPSDLIDDAFMEVERAQVETRECQGELIQ
ncbi:hypothetical protein DKX38_030189 [Salix brachista]|uniref:Uncharacterized protein n=1 Tax=Salix brachista TaxID=2182728 RepID=A0A5N5IZU5_9ROSI|nr:hypothetical protein DKX38_030189 [Salix brachista]